MELAESSRIDLESLNLLKWFWLNTLYFKPFVGPLVVMYSLWSVCYFTAGAYTFSWMTLLCLKELIVWGLKSLFAVLFESNSRSYYLVVLDSSLCVWWVLGNFLLMGEQLICLRRFSLAEGLFLGSKEFLMTFLSLFLDFIFNLYFKNPSQRHLIYYECSKFSCKTSLVLARLPISSELNE